MSDREGADEDAVDGVRSELFEDEDAAAREQRIVQPEGRILRGRGDERDETGFDDGEKLEDGKAR